MFLYYQDKFGRRETLGAQRFPRPPEPALRGLFCAHNRPPAHHCCVMVQRAIDVGRAVSVHVTTPSLSRLGGLRVVQFLVSPTTVATCRLRAAPPGWMVPRGYHPSRGPSAPAPTCDALHRACTEMGGAGPAPRPAALPPKGGVAPRRRAGPPGPEPRRREAGGEPRRQAPEGGRSGGRAAARPPNRAQPNRQGREGTPEVGQATGRQARRRGVSPDHPHRRGAGGRPEPWRGGQAAAVRPQPHCCDKGGGPGRPAPPASHL